MQSVAIQITQIHIKSEDANDDGSDVTDESEDANDGAPDNSNQDAHHKANNPSLLPINPPLPHWTQISQRRVRP